MHSFNKNLLHLHVVHHLGRQSLYEPSGLSAGAEYPVAFCSMKWQGVFLLSPRWDASHRATPSIKFASSLSYTYRWRKALREKCLTRKKKNNNTMPPLGLEPGPLDMETSALAMRSCSSPTVHHLSSAKLFFSGVEFCSEFEVALPKQVLPVIANQ